MDRRIIRWGIAGTLLGSLALGASAPAKSKLTATKSSRSSQASEAAQKPDSIRWLTDLRVAHHVSVATGRPMLIVFGGPWCHLCKKLEKEVLAQPTLAKYINTMFVPVHVDLGVQENQKISQTLEIKGIPTAVVLNANADLIGFIEGYVDAPKFAQALKGSLEYQRTLAAQQVQPASASSRAK
jgi:thioredoxin-like negative regulator of GroEL